MATVVQDRIKEAATELLTKLCRPNSISKPKTSVKRKKGPVKQTRHFVSSSSSAHDASAAAETVAQERPDDLLRKIKEVCKMYPQEGPAIVCQILLKNHLMIGRTSSERERALICIDELFQRSSKFRSEVCESLRVVLDAVFGDSVPGPHAAQLSEKAARILQEWNRTFGRLYPQLGLGLALKKIPVDSGAPALKDAAESMRASVDAVRADEIQRGFRIYDGVPLTGTGETDAALISLAVMKLSEMRTCLLMLLPFLDQDDDDQGGPSPFTSSTMQDDDDGIEWEEEEPTGNGDAVAHDISSEEQQEDVVESEVYIPQDFELQLTTRPSESAAQADNGEESMRDVRQALLDCRLTIEREVLPVIRPWSDIFEREVSRRPNDVERMNLLIRVKRLLSDLLVAVEHCDRLDVKSRRPRPNKSRRIVPSGSASAAVSKKRRRTT